MGLMADEQLLIYADALYQLGSYNHAIETLNLLSNKYLIIPIYPNEINGVAKLFGILDKNSKYI